jgi:ubiquinone/menaquinone biosynthesis C-methylase UbiE
MDSGLQRRIQRYGWDRAADDYEPLWRAQLAPAHAELLARAALAPGERVLDVACGTGLVAIAAARTVGAAGRVVGVDLSARMVDVARRQAAGRAPDNVEFVRMDAQQLALPDAPFDVVLCALGLMYMPDPAQALAEMRRVLRPGGRVVLAVWGEAARCGWSALFPIVDAEVATDVCPLFFQLGQAGALARRCVEAGFAAVRSRRIAATLSYADADEACAAAFVGGPVALAWSRFAVDVRARARARYLESIAGWQRDGRYGVPGEFVVVAARVPGPRHPGGRRGAHGAARPARPRQNERAPRSPAEPVVVPAPDAGAGG